MVSLILVIAILSISVKFCYCELRESSEVPTAYLGFTLCLLIILWVRSGSLSGHLLVNSCPLGWPYDLIVVCLFVFFIYFPLWF